VRTRFQEFSLPRPLFKDYYLQGTFPMKKALVAGALGVSGRALVSHLVTLGDWEVIALSRRKPDFKSPARQKMRFIPH
jgi:hypothetical protein